MSTDPLFDALTGAAVAVPPLVALPVGAAVTVVARSVIGARTVGVFAPALLAIASVHVGIGVAAATVAIAALTGVALIPLIDRLAISRVARLALLLCGICAAVEAGGLGVADQAALPLVVLSVIIERCWDCSVAEGWRSSLQLIAGSLAVAIVIAFLLVLPPVRTAAGSGGLALIASCGATILAAGSYRGLRWSERGRFWALAPAGGV